MFCFIRRSLECALGSCWFTPRSSVAQKSKISMLNPNPNFDDGGSRRASTRSNLAETGELRRTSTINPEQGQLRRTSTMNPEQGQLRRTSTMNPEQGDLRRTSEMRRASMSLGLAPGPGDVARRVSNLNQIPENGVAENDEAPGSVIPKRTSTMSQSGGVRSIKIRRASVALHSMDECLPGRWKLLWRNFFDDDF